MFSDFVSERRLCTTEVLGVNEPIYLKAKLFYDVPTIFQQLRINPVRIS